MERMDVVVIGGGPAGLMAAETIAARGHRVLIAEAKPSLGRKFLMAGKSGLNLTKAEPPDDFASTYPEGADWLAPMLAAFGPEAVQDWARGLGQEVFTGSSGRVFPVAMKASPLLRAWAVRLADLGVTVRTRWRWQGWQHGLPAFATLGGDNCVDADVTVLALGGGSWARLGSDASWVPLLRAGGVEVAPFRPSNVGFGVNWTEHMARHFGAPVKAVALTAGGQRLRGEFVITCHGIEGGVVYALAPALRDGAPLVIDLMPYHTAEAIARRLGRPRGKTSLSNHFRTALNLPAVKLALMREFAPAALADPSDAASALKALPVPLTGPRPIDEAISTAGGVARSAVDEALMLRARPGTFCAGEMLDWDAPTGGYLLTACLATGRWAGKGAADWLETGGPSRAQIGV
jgi:uncharacterized flavoprotein (TIGR03862 family)